jgi:hypothetical protein
VSAAWTAGQQRCLAALGYTLFRLASRTSGDANRATLQSSAIDPLLRALLRAAGRDPERTDAEAWLREMAIAPLEQLRMDPAAKRELWPRLRATRRERGRS